MTHQIPRIMIAGTSSGCGKTTITCAILQALVQRGRRVGAFKCGPDYIDPMFHSRIIGAKASNLDSFFFSGNTVNYLLALNGQDCDLNVIEGVMGYFDGLGISSSRASSCEIAEITKSPVILTVNAKGASLSVLAVISGFLQFSGTAEHRYTTDSDSKQKAGNPSSRICGVILNQCTAMTYPVLAEAIRSYFNGAVEPLGYMPVMKECSLESRHLGLVTAAEVEDLKDKLRMLAEQAEKSIDLDRLIQIAQQAEPSECEPPVLPHFEEPVRIAVARDKAFCFYYEDSLDLLRRMGAELISFSPMADPCVPSDADGLYLGGGYPELYAEKLSENISMLGSVRSLLKKGIPCIAECGGFMYLTEKIGEYPMAGVIPGTCHDTGRLSRFGYVTLKAETDNLLCRKGEQIQAHEFHHWDTSDPGDSFRAEKLSGKTWSCVHASDHLYAGYPHFHFYANPVFAENFYHACLKYRKEKHSL